MSHKAHGLKFTTAIIRQEPPQGEIFTGITHWVGGMRFEDFKTRAEAIEWTERSIAEVRDNFSMVSTNIYWVAESGLINCARKEKIDGK